MPRPFLIAAWRSLTMLNYAVDPSLLQPLVPAGTTLDQWNGTTYVSVVGFWFEDTRLLGVPIPFHRHFEEVNLRFYVRRMEGSELRRGVVFVRELVPRIAIAAVARWTYNEPYLAVPMDHSIDIGDSGGRVEYRWRFADRWSSLSAAVTGAAQELRDGSEEEFITEHYWGYTPQRDGSTIEYRVEHPRWRVWRAERASLQGSISELYGASFGEVLSQAPLSAFVAEGSPITVHNPRRLP